MKKILLSLMLLLGLASAAFAGKLSIQGHLANGGTPTDGWHLMTFTFFSDSTGGTSLWTETDSVFVQSCLFSAVLGRAVAIPDVVFAGTAWLETSVDGTTLAPRVGYYPQPVNVGPGQWQGDGTDVWRTGGFVAVTGATSNHDARPAVGSTPIAGELHAYSAAGSNMDDGLLRLSAGGGTNYGSTKTFIDLSGYSTVPDMYNNIVFGTSGYEHMRLDTNGRLGIGTGAPEFPLDIQTPDYSHGLRYLVTGDSPAGAGSYVILATNDSRGAILIGNSAPWGGAYPADNAALWETTGGWQWNKQLNIMGPVGINTNSPTATLTVNGSFTATGTKCREVDAPRYGKIYYNAVESGNAIFTTSGRARLAEGRAHVELDPKWLAGVTVDDQHPLDVSSIVFHAPHGEWHVEIHDASFDVIEDGHSDAAFFWTVQAAQKGYENRYLDQDDQTVARR